MARRYDVGRLDAPVKTSQGFLRVPATIARTGIQLYRQPDGSERREYRSPSEVGHADALASFSLAPLTLLHPPVPVTAANAQQYAKGTMGEAIAFDEGKGLVCCTALITDADAIKAVSDGMRQLSCGYECDVDETPGVTPGGEKYDAVQKNIRGNHVSIVPTGRAGAGVCLKLDSENNAVPSSGEPSPQPTTEGEPTVAMKTVKIDGVDAEVSETAAQLLSKHLKDRDDALAEMQGKLADAGKACESTKKDAAEQVAKANVEAEKQKARADAADEAKTKAEKAHADAIDPVKLKAVIAARVQLEKTAAALAPGLKLDGLDDAGIRKAVVAKLSPDLKLDGKSPDYIGARFDLALEQLQKVNPAAAALAAILAPGGSEAEEKARSDAEEKAKLDSDPRAKFMRDQVELGEKMGRGAET